MADAVARPRNHRQKDLSRPASAGGDLSTRLLAGLFILGGYVVTLEGQLHWRTPVKQASSGSLKHGDDGIDWKPWSLAAVEQARKDGHPVFVDFTADWCVTCQVNKRTSIEIPSVRAKLKGSGAVTLLGDYTRKDDAITQELKRFSRAGVPLVLVYPKNPNDPPLVLPEILTPGIVIEALEKAAGTPGKDSQTSLTSTSK